MTRKLHACALLAWSVALAGCTTLPQERLPGDLISGRLSVRVEATEGAAGRALSAVFELQGNADQGRLDLATPLGTMLAQVRWLPGSATLATSQDTSPYPDLNALTTHLLGESVPIAALFDWLRGRPWPAAPSTALPDATRAGFSQLDWQVDLTAFGDALVIARRDRPPAVTVRAKVDRL
jgi:outer membrane lipoprotein LolB